MAKKKTKQSKTEKISIIGSSLYLKSSFEIQAYNAAVKIPLGMPGLYP